jgi:hypothetical protein
MTIYGKEEWFNQDVKEVSTNIRDIANIKHK